MLSSNNLMKNKKKKGFSLLEIVVSLGLIALFIIPAGNMVLGTVKINKASENKQQASAVLQETVEYIKGIENMPNGGQIFELDNDVEIKRDSSMDQVIKDEEGNIVKDKDGNPKMKVCYQVKTKADFETQYGFTVNGEIYGEEILTEIEDKTITEEVEGLSGKVDGVLYYGYKKSWVINKKEPLKLIDAINIPKPTRIEDFITEEKLEIDNRGNGIFKFGPNGKFTIKRMEGAILIILDGYTVPFRFNIDITGGKNVLIYLYDKSGKITKDDIQNNNSNATIKIINVGQGDGNGGSGNITGSINISGSATNIYSVKINAVKNGNSIDNLSVDFVK